MNVGENVLIRLPTNETRVICIDSKGTVNLGKFGSFKTVELVGQAYGQTFEIESDKSLKALPPRSLLEVEETDATNEFINDTGREVQPMTAAEILEMKERGMHVSDIIQKQIEQHSNYELKTEYSKDKYRKRKEAKFSRGFTVLEPTVFNMSEYWLSKDPNKIREIRADTLGQMMNLGNIYPGGRYLVVDDTGGMVLAAIIDRLNGQGRILAITDVDSPPVFHVLNTFNFPSDMITPVLRSLNWAAVDEHHTPILPPLEPSEGNFRSDRQKIKLARRKTAIDNLTETREDLFAGEWSGLIVASEYEPFSVVKRLTPYLAGSANIIIYSPHSRILTETQHQMRQCPEYLAPSITEPWLRRYQVAPGRTHPTMNTSGSGGYLLHTFKVYDTPSASSLAQKRREDRKSAAINRRRRIESQPRNGEGSSTVDVSMVDANSDL